MAIALRQSTNVAGKHKREEEEEEKSVKKAIALSLQEDSAFLSTPPYPQEDDIPEFWCTPQSPSYGEMESQPIIPLRNTYVAAPAPVSVSVSISVSQVQVPVPVPAPAPVLSPFDQFMMRNHPESLTARSLNARTNRANERINPSAESSRFQEQITRLHPRETYGSTSDSDSEINDDDYHTV